MSTTADSIQTRMQEVRRDMGADMAELVESARDLTDWRAYVRRYPLVCLGAAAAFGYLVVPKRLELVSPDADTLMELAKRNKLVVKANPEPRARSGWAAGALNSLLNAAMRGAVAYAGQQLGKQGGDQAASSE